MLKLFAAVCLVFGISIASVFLRVPKRDPAMAQSKTESTESNDVKGPAWHQKPAPNTLEPPEVFNIDQMVEHHYASSLLNLKTKIHYVTLGHGPELVVMIHGFPDYWYTWRNQMAALYKTGKYRIAAMDMRGYNLSDKPFFDFEYKGLFLIEDIKAVISSEGKDKATIIAHDWGAVLSWRFTMLFPDLVEKLVVFNISHPANINREMVINPDQYAAGLYAREFQEGKWDGKIQSEDLSYWVKNPEVKAKYDEAFLRTSVPGIINYYKQNYPKPPYKIDPTLRVKIKCPVLQIEGLEDNHVVPAAMNDPMKLVENYSILVLPDVGHFSQHGNDDPKTLERINQRILDFLK